MTPAEKRKATMAKKKEAARRVQQQKDVELAAERRKYQEGVKETKKSRKDMIEAKTARRKAEKELEALKAEMVSRREAASTGDAPPILERQIDQPVRDTPQQQPTSDSSSESILYFCTCTLRMRLKHCY